MNRFSLSSDSRLWWLPAGAAGVAASGALAAALVVVPSGATAEPWSPWDIQPGYAHIPADDVRSGHAHVRGHDCPPPLDPNYAAGPWVAPDSACPTLRHWWRYVH